MTTGSFLALHCTRLYRLNSKKRLEYVAGEKYEAADRRGERGYRRSLRTLVVGSRGTFILGEVRKLEISRVTQQLLCSKVHIF